MPATNITTRLPLTTAALVALLLAGCTTEGERDAQHAAQVEPASPAPSGNDARQRPESDERSLSTTPMATPISPREPSALRKSSADAGQHRLRDTAPRRQDSLQTAPAHSSAEQAQPYIPQPHHRTPALIRPNAQVTPQPASPIYGSAVPEREHYPHYPANPAQRVSEAPVSTFALDVDTASYALLRRDLQQGRLPHPGAVRAEELINYFDYSLPSPTAPDQPFSLSTEIAPSPWNSGKHLVAVGIQAYKIDSDRRPPINLTLLIDTSGSMQATNKLPLLKQAMRALVQQLSAADRVSIVTYAGSAGVVLSPTAGDQRTRILNALERLQASGSTNGSAGIQLAYQVARQSGLMEGRSLVMLATDGDLNVGITDIGTLKQLIEFQRRTTGVAFSTLGFGSGNYNDALMSELSQLGDGTSHYIDTLLEARKALVENLSGTLYRVAADAKVQIEWNPQTVAEYRLVGYENRHLAREDFNNDQVDAGDIGSGHSLLALYEISLRGADHAGVDPLRYQGPAAEEVAPRHPELGYLKIRYKQPGAQRSLLIEKPLLKREILTSLDRASDNLRWAAAVAGMAELLKGGTQVDSHWDYPAVIALAQSARGEDAGGYRAEFIRLAQTASALQVAWR